MTPTQRAAAQQALEALEAVRSNMRMNAPQLSGKVWGFADETITALRDALASQPAEPQDPVAYNGWVLREVLFDNGEPVGHREPTRAAPQEPVEHDEDLLERLYWEFDRQRKKTGEERLAFKGKMRFYASDFRRVSIGKAAFSQSVTDDMMNLADRLGSEYDDVDPKAWKHLLVYAPQPAKRVPLTDDDIDVLWAKQQTKPFKTHAEDRMAFASAVIAAYDAKNGITGETK